MRLFREDIFSILNSVEGSGDFVTSGINQFIQPGLEIKGLGELGFPLNQIQIKAIIGAAKQAPFGKGSETILDTNVRRSREIDATLLKFCNLEWEDFLGSVLKKVKKKLGIEEHLVEANLYKLLIYETGDFFLPHKDSEKEKGMFGTLIIGLPSKHTGGELLIRFGGDEEIADFSIATANYKIPHVAFFADCEHEIKPVTSGYRVCLVYNLVQKSNGSKLGGPEFIRQIENLSKYLKDQSENIGNRPIAVLLGHQYTPANFAQSALKNNDAPRAEVLMKAAENAGYFAKLGLVTSYIHGELEGDFSYSRRRYEHFESEGTMGEVYDSHIKVENWASGGIPDLGSFELEEKNIYSNFELNNNDPIETEEEGYTGNAGMTIDYWYHYGAVILWHKDQHPEILSNLPSSVLMKWLTFYLNNFDNDHLKSAEYLKKIIEQLEGFRLTGNERLFRRAEPIDFSPIASTLTKLDNSDLIQKSLGVLASVFQYIRTEVWEELFENSNQELFLEIFKNIGLEGDLYKTKHLLDLLSKLQKNEQPPLISFFKKQLKNLPHYLAKTDLVFKKGEYKYFSGDKLPFLGAIHTILKNTIILGENLPENSDWHTKTIESITKSLPRAFVNESLFPIIADTSTPNTFLKKALAEICLKDLKNRVANKPIPPSDWSRPMPKNIDNYYEDTLKKLAAFMASPSQQFFDYQAIQRNRSTMESAIRNVAIDLDMTTIRTRPAHTLRLIKNQATFEEKFKKWEYDFDLLKKLEEDHLS